MTGVHASAHIGRGVELGERVTVGPFAVLVGPCIVGDGVWIGPHASIGTPAQMRGGLHPPFDGTPAGIGVAIGDDTVLREFVTVHQGMVETTQVGRDCFVMAYGHVPHDAVIGDGCTISNSVQIGGHTWMGEGANIGLGASVHQRSVIGAFAMVGMQAAVTRPVPPFAMAMGLPARVVGANRVPLERLGLAPEQIQDWSDRLAAGEVVGAGSIVGSHIDRYQAALARVQPKTTAP